MNSYIREFLEQNTKDSVPAYLYDRFFFGHIPDFSKDANAYKKVKESKWYRELQMEQREDGSFGRFHTMDSKDKKKQVFPTTELAVSRMHDLMLPADDTIVKRTAEVLHDYISRKAVWSDPVKKQFGYEVMLQSMAAANISLLGVKDSLCKLRKKAVAEYLEEMVQKDGSIDQREWQQKMRTKFDLMLLPETIHIVWLLYQNDEVSKDIERPYLRYLWEKEDGIYDAKGICACCFQKVESKKFSKWLYVLEQFSGTRSFPGLMEDGAYEFLEQECLRIVNGEVSTSAFTGKLGRYHENWRNEKRRDWDIVARMARLLLLAE